MKLDRCLKSRRLAPVLRTLEVDELVRLAQHEHSSSQAFDELVHRFWPRTYAVLYRLSGGHRTVAEDLAQETFLRAFRGLAKFERRSAFSTWLHRIAYFAFLNHANRNQKLTALPECFEDTVCAKLGELSCAQADLRRDVDTALEQLPQHYRLMLELHFLASVPYRDIAKQLNVPLGTVKTQIHRAKRLMRNKMDGWSDDSELALSA